MQHCCLKCNLFHCETLSSPLLFPDADIELTQAQSAAVTVNGVPDGDNASIKDVEVEIETKEEKIFPHETTPPIFPTAAIGGSSPYLYFASDSMPTAPPIDKEDTTRV